jgi:hypothetical protein
LKAGERKPLAGRGFSCAREAILRYLDDREDIRLAERELEEVRAGRSGTMSLEDVMRFPGDLLDRLETAQPDSISRSDMRKGHAVKAFRRRPYDGAVRHGRVRGRHKVTARNHRSSFKDRPGNGEGSAVAAADPSCIFRISRWAELHREKQMISILMLAVYSPDTWPG